MNELTYFLFIEDYKLDIGPEEEMMEYLRANCPIPTDEDLEEMWREFNE